MGSALNRRKRMARVGLAIALGAFAAFAAVLFVRSHRESDGARPAGSVLTETPAVDAGNAHKERDCGSCAPTAAEQSSVTTHAQCASWTTCKKDARCLFAPLDFGSDGRCIAAELRVHARFPLTESRHGIRGQLVLLLDSRFGEPDAGGVDPYLLDPDEPRAGSAVQLRTAADELVDEETLFPLLALEKEDLGTGTDTFLATEQPFCSAGHWCGFNTIFFEVRAGRLTRLRARGRGDTARALELTASNGERWKVERNSASGKRDIIDQHEGARGVPDDPAFKETRFYFEGGRWRFVERATGEFQPRVMKQPGAWHGTLQFQGNE